MVVRFYDIGGNVIGLEIIDRVILRSAEAPLWWYAIPLALAGIVFWLRSRYRF